LIVGTTEGCKDTLVRDVVINPIAAPNFTNTEPCIGDTMFFTNTTTISSGSIDETNGYTWLFEEQPSVTSGVKNPKFLYNAAGTHFVMLTAVSDSGCVNTFRKVVRVNSLPEMPEINADVVCAGDKAVLSIDPTQADIVRWYTSPNAGLEPFHTGNSYISPELSTTTTYYVQLTTTAGCISPFYPVTGTVHLPEDVQMVISNTQVEMPSQPISFSTQSTIPLVSWSWNFADETTSQSPTPVHEYKTPGRYTVLLTTKDENGCIFTLNGNIEVRRVVTVTVPTAFSPNDDGTNDKFFIGSYNISTFYIGIYNRWGTLVYESNNPSFQWDGKDKNGKVIPEGVYVFVMKATTFDGVKEDKTGTITVTR
jgi:gliding motility-associated-like protein